MQKRVTRNIAPYTPKDYCEICGYKPIVCEFCNRRQSTSIEMVQCHSCGKTFCLNCIGNDQGKEKCQSCGSTDIGDA